jgi:hypothetical protein
MKLISVHIPKTGGITFRKHLERVFGSKRVFLDYNHTDRPDYKPGPPKPYLLAQLRKTKKTTAIHGHLFLSTYHRPAGVQRCMWFRDPIERLLSHYYYWLRSPDFDHPNCQRLHEDGLSVVEFAEIPELKNVFTRFLDGTPMHELDFIGLVEDYQRSLKLFYAMYAPHLNPAELTEHINKNVAKDNSRYRLGDKERKRLETLNHRDMGLYAEAKSIFEKLVIRYGDGF